MDCFMIRGVGTRSYLTFGKYSFFFATVFLQPASHFLLNKLS